MSAYDEEEPAREDPLVIRCGHCGAPVPDESLDRLWLALANSVTCRGCSAVIELKLADFDAYADSLLFTIEHFKELARG